MPLDGLNQSSTSIASDIAGSCFNESVITVFASAEESGSQGIGLSQRVADELFGNRMDDRVHADVNDDGFICFPGSLRGSEHQAEPRHAQDHAQNDPPAT